MEAVCGGLLVADEFNTKSIKADIGNFSHLV
jgi:hypothetical protein